MDYGKHRCIKAGWILAALLCLAGACAQQMPTHPEYEPANPTVLTNMGQ